MLLPDVACDFNWRTRGVSATPQDWKRLGEKIRLRRERLGLTRPDVVARSGSAVTERTLGNYETGRSTSSGRIPPGYYAVAEVIGWTHDSVQDVLDGNEPTFIARPTGGGEAALLADIASRYATVADFGVFCERLGGGTAERDAYDVAARRLLESIPGVTVEAILRGQFALAASRPHDPSGVAPLDDVLRAVQAVEGSSGS
jgi:hypothetical protein